MDASKKNVSHLAFGIVMLLALTVAAGLSAEEQSLGSVTFKLDGVEMAFDHIGKSGTLYTAHVTTMRAQPGADATERIIIHISLVDLKKLDYPAILPRAKDQSRPKGGAPALDSVVISYSDANGAKWTGPGLLRIESFGRDGVVEGAFDGVTLPHADKELPDIQLTEGIFRVQITSLW